MRATADTWKRIPFTEGVRIPYSPSFSVEEVQKLERGLVPKEMEDKWFVFFEAPYLFLHRSWTGAPVYRVELAYTPLGADVKEALLSKGQADAKNPDPSYEAKLLDFLVSNLLLGQRKPFPHPGNVREPFPGMLQHHISGTGYSETRAAAKRSWWPLWRWPRT